MRKQDYDLEIALIMKKVYNEEGAAIFLPKKVVEGYYNDEEQYFTDLEGTNYYHIIDNVENYGFFERENLCELKQLYPYFSINFLKQQKLKKSKHNKNLYLFKVIQKFNVPIIGEYNTDSNKIKQIVDADVYKFYFDNYPNYFYSLSNENLEPDMEDEPTTGCNQKDTLELNINEIYKEVTSRVLGQNEPIKKILTAIWKQQNQTFEKKSRNILINGSTGVGKTETIRVLSELLNLPLVITSATEYSATGYVGKNVNEMLVSLLNKTNGDLEQAQKGILVIDEFDKLAESNNERSQINQRDVQESLLKILEDGEFEIEYNYDNYTFNTSNLMVIGMGSWSRIDLTPKTSIGFGSTTTQKKYKDLTREDIIKNGLIPELIARFSVIVQMNELTYDNFVSILKNKNGIIELNKQFLKTKGIDLIVEKETIDLIAKKAEKDNYGARGLDEIIERILSSALFEIATNPEKYCELIITKDSVENSENYILVEKGKIKELTNNIN